MSHLILMIKFQRGWGEIIWHLIPSGQLTYYGSTLWTDSVGETSSKESMDSRQYLPQNPANPPFRDSGRRGRSAPTASPSGVTTTESVLTVSCVQSEAVGRVTTQRCCLSLGVEDLSPSGGLQCLFPWATKEPTHPAPSLPWGTPGRSAALDVHPSFQDTCT